MQEKGEHRLTRSQYAQTTSPTVDVQRGINARCCNPENQDDVSAAVPKDTTSPLVGDLLGTKRQLLTTKERLHHHKGKEKVRRDLSLRAEVVKTPMQHGHLKLVWR